MMFCFTCFQTSNTCNIGDDIQTIALLRLICDTAHENFDEVQYDLSFVPDHMNLSSRVIELCFKAKKGTDSKNSVVVRPVFVERDRYKETCNVDKKYIYGWHQHKIDGGYQTGILRDGEQNVFLSFHVSKELRAYLEKNPTICSQYQKFAPIACRDPGTEQFFKAHNIDAHCTFCITLSMKNAYPNESMQRKKVLYVDANCNSREFELHNKEFLTHANSEFYSWTCSRRLNHAQNLLDEYACAAYVVTSRIHCALPCIAFGTPVRFVNSDGNPVLTPTKSDNFYAPERLEGFIDLFRLNNQDNQKVVGQFCHAIRSNFMAAIRVDMEKSSSVWSEKIAECSSSLKSILENFS